MQKGQSIFEIVIAIAISAVIMTVIVALSVDSLSTSNYSKNKSLANKHVSDTVEWLRYNRAGMSWNDFETGLTSSANWCMIDLPTSTNFEHSVVFLSSYEHFCDRTDPNDVILNQSIDYFRDMAVSTSGDRIDVTVIVSWREPDGWHESRTSTSLVEY